MARMGAYTFADVLFNIYYSVIGAVMIATIIAATVSSMLVTKTDIDIVTRVVAGEARNQHETAIEGVCNVIYNRTKLGRWGDASAVVQARKQFSALNVGDPNRPVILAKTFRNTRSYDRIQRICRSVFAGRDRTSYLDVTDGADHYYSGSVVPYWARGLNPRAHIGAFKFFKLFKHNRKVRFVAARSTNEVRRVQGRVIRYNNKEDRRLLTLLIRSLTKEAHAH